MSEQDERGEFIERSEFMRSYNNRLDELFPTLDAKNQLISTLFSNGMTFIDALTFFLTKGIKLPHQVNYAMALFANNFLAVSGYNPVGVEGATIEDLTFDHIKDESMEEECYRKLKIIIKIIHQIVVDEELEEERLKKFVEKGDESG